MPLLDVQRRGLQLGRVRIGQTLSKVNDRGEAKSYPSKLDTFRLTTATRLTADAVADMFGGTVAPFEPERGGGSGWEVITSVNTLPVMVPPADRIVTQFYEKWGGGGIERRCDSQYEQIGAKPCLCPFRMDDEGERVPDPEERARLAGLNPPRACKPTTRVSFMIPDLPGLGVWRLDTHSYYAAVEMGAAGDLLQGFADRGVYLPAQIRIDQRERRVQGQQAKRFPVPVLEVLHTVRQLATGQVEGGIVAALPPAPTPARTAITAGPSASPPAPRSAEGESRGQARVRDAQAIAVEARRAGTDALDPLIREARGNDLLDHMVSTDEAGDIWEPLGEFLRHRWAEEGGDR